jgi:hypothetical protein
MSGDPFANTTTVKNILQHIISPKLVNDGSGGYVSKTDLVNVHNLVFSGGASNEDGLTSLKAFTTQCGVSFTTGTYLITIYHSRVTANSIILAQNRSYGSLIVVSIIPTTGSFSVTFNTTSSGYNIEWFIARF